MGGEFIKRKHPFMRRNIMKIKKDKLKLTRKDKKDIKLFLKNNKQSLKTAKKFKKLFF
jgi:hypothetical protein